MLAELLADIQVVENSEDERVASVLSGCHHADRASARQLHRRVRAHAGVYQSTPSASLLARASETHAALNLVATNVHEGRTGKVTHTALSESACLMSQLLWDASGRTDEVCSVAYCDQAVAAAMSNGDVVAAAHAELRRSFIFLYGLRSNRNPRAGQVAAEAAAETARHSSHALTGLALLHVADALAMQNEHRLTERTLGEAQQHIAQITSDDRGAKYFSPSQVGRLTGSCYLSLNDPAQAQRALESAAATLPNRPKSRSLVLGNLAISLIRQRELEAATSTLMEAIDIVERTRGGAGTNVVFTACRELYPWRREPVVQDVNDMLLALMAGK